MEQIKKIRDMLLQIIIDLKRNNTKTAFAAFHELLPSLNQIIMKFMKEIPAYKEMGADIPQDVLLTQLNNLSEALEHQDTVMLADTLEYEILITLNVYEEILSQV